MNAKNHSAGHLIDVAMKNIGLAYLKPTKGFHFPEGSYVEYEGTFSESPEVSVEKLNSELVKLIEANKKVVVTYHNFQGIVAPIGKTPRYVQFEGESWCGCWGTHVTSTWEIGSIRVRKMKYKAGCLRVSYEIWSAE